MFALQKITWQKKGHFMNRFISRTCPGMKMNNSTLCPVDVVGITVSPRVKHKMYLWFVVTRVHLLLRSCNDCFSEAHWVLQTFQKTWQTSDFKRLDKQNLLKKCMLKKKGGTTRASSFRVKNDKCHSSADMRLGFSFCSWKLITQHLQPRTGVCMTGTHLLI